MRAAAAAGLLACGAAATPVKSGPYKTSSQKYTVDALDASSKDLHVYWPTGGKDGEKYPLISYAHGMAGGGIDILGYAELFGQMASYGFIIAAPAGCGEACKDKVGAPYTDCAGLPGVAPKGWASYYGQQLVAIDFARNQTADPVFSTVDWDAGVGIAGHSMGGQSTTIAAGAKCAAKWGIKAAVLHHAANGDTKDGNIGVNISVPLAAFTSSGDGIWKETRDQYEASPVKPKVYRDQVGFSHLEPVLAPPIENPYLATFTAAWFKIYLNGDKADYYGMIYGGGPDSLCKYANMTECVIEEH